LTREEANAKIAELVEQAKLALEAAEDLAKKYELTFEFETDRMPSSIWFRGRWNEYDEWNGSSC
jgi:hypothetical protein